MKLGVRRLLYIEEMCNAFGPLPTFTIGDGSFPPCKGVQIRIPYAFLAFIVVSFSSMHAF